MRHQVLILIFILGIIIQESLGFIIQVKQGDRRCFKAEQSPDKVIFILLRPYKLKSAFQEDRNKIATCCFQLIT